MIEFVARLKQRKVVQWSIAYLAFGFSLIQVVDVVAGSYGWPHLVMHLVFGLLVLGFIVALLLAWYHGERGAQSVSGPELLLIALALAIGGGLLWHFGKGSSPATPIAAEGGHVQSVTVAHSTPAEAAVADAGRSPPSASAGPFAKSIAVLPFKSLSADPDNAYFAAGIQDLILTKLADIGGLRVVSRTSTERYASHPADVKSPCWSRCCGDSTSSTIPGGVTWRWPMQAGSSAASSDRKSEPTVSLKRRLARRAVTNGPWSLQTSCSTRSEHSEVGVYRQHHRHNEGDRS